MSCTMPADSKNGWLMERGGKRSATPLFLREEITRARGKSAVVAALCRRSPKKWGTPASMIHTKTRSKSRRKFSTVVFRV